MCISLTYLINVRCSAIKHKVGLRTRMNMRCPSLLLLRLPNLPPTQRTTCPLVLVLSTVIAIVLILTLVMCIYCNI